MTQLPRGYTVTEMPSGDWYVTYIDDGVKVPGGLYEARDRAVLVAQIYYERERAK